MTPLEVVQEVRSQYPAAMTEEQCVKCSNEVAWRLNDRAATGPWGLRRKSSGTQWGGYSLDVIVNRAENYGVDILISAPAPATPSWQDQIAAPPEGWQAVWAPVVLDWLPGIPFPPDPPDPPPTGDLEDRVTSLELALEEVRTVLQKYGY